MIGKITFVFLVSCFVMAQTVAVQKEPIDLVATSKIVVANANAYDFVHPVVDDEYGNIYLRYGSGGAGPSPILRLDRSGEKLAQFVLPPNLVLLGARIASFAIADRELLVLAKTPPPNVKISILSFDLDGELRTVTTIPNDLDPFCFAPVGGGNLLLGGRMRPDGDPARKDGISVSAIAIFDTNRSSLRIIASPENDVAPVDSQHQEAANRLAKRDTDYENAIQSSVMKAADDGNVYLMRHGHPGFFFVVSPAGQIVRRFTIDVPAGSTLADFRVRGGRLAAVLRNSSPEGEVAATTIRTYETQTGQLIGDYRLEGELKGSLLARFDGIGQFTFIRGDGHGNLVLLVGESR